MIILITKKCKTGKIKWQSEKFTYIATREGGKKAEIDLSCFFFTKRIMLEICLQHKCLIQWQITKRSEATNSRFYIPCMSLSPISPKEKNPKNQNLRGWGKFSSFMDIWPAEIEQSDLLNEFGNVTFKTTPDCTAKHPDKSIAKWMTY